MNTSRRNFIKKTTTAAAGLGLLGTANAMSAKSYNNIIGANDRINVAIQGLGRRYSGFIDGIAEKQNNIRLQYLCDVMPSQLEKAQLKVGEKIDVPGFENHSGIINKISTNKIWVVLKDLGYVIKLKIA